MRKLTTLLIVLGVIVAGILLGWLGTGNRGNVPPAPDTTPGRASNPGIARTGSTTNPLGQAEVLLPVTPPSPTAAGALITNWEERVDQILTSDGSDADKAKQMLEMFPHLSQEGQVEVAQHLSNLLPDQDYAALGKFLTDAKLPEDVLDELMADILNRPNSLKLPYLLEVAKETDHPKAAEAKDLLELFLEEDYGTDWPKWQTKLDAWLKDNPD